MYGHTLLVYLAEKLTAKFGKGFSERNLHFMRRFYNVFPIRHALCAELETHYRLLIRLEESNRREFYLTESADSSRISRQSKRQIISFYYERLLAT